MKVLYILLVGLCLIGSATAAHETYYNVTNMIGTLQPEIVGGSNVVSMHPHHEDTWFSLYNAGTVTYQIYAYDYRGVGEPMYQDGCYGAIEPEQLALLCNNGSYYIYADYDTIQDMGSVEAVEKVFFQWWYIVVVILVILISVIVLYGVIKK